MCWYICQVLVHPLGSFTSNQRVWFKMLPCWLCALVFATPQLFIFVQVEEVHPGTGDDDSPLRSTLACKSAGYTAEWQRKAYFTFLTSYILVVPTIIMVYCYASIIRVIWLRSRTCRSPGEKCVSLDRPRIHFVSAHKAGLAASAIPGWRRDNPLRCSSHLRRAASFQPYHRTHRGVADSSALSRLALSSKRTVVKMTMLVVVSFVVCWTPYFAVSLVRIYSEYAIELEEVLSISEIMALGHSAVNPLLYMIYSRRAVRTFFWQIRRRVQCFTCHCRTTRRSSSPPLPQQPPPPSAVHVTENGRNDSECARSRRKWFIESDGGAEGDVGHTGGAYSAPCHVTYSWSSSLRREASAATDCRPYRRHVRMLSDDKLVPYFTAAPVTSCRLSGPLSPSSRD